jgi:multidrug efflux system membrane fusion protein
MATNRTNRGPFPAVRSAAVRSALAMLAVTLCLSCSKSESRDERARGIRSIPVTVAPVVRKDVPLEVNTFGMAQSKASVTIKAKLSQVILAVHFKEGDLVARGALLFTLDSQPYRVKLEQARATLGRNSVLAAGAQADLRRATELLGAGMLSQADFDKLRTTADALTETLKADQATIDAAQIDVDNCRITSPIDGRAGKILVDPGNLVSASTMPLVVINQVKPMDVFFSLPQAELDRIRSYQSKAGLEVEVTLPEDPGPAMKGRLTFIDNLVDSSNGTIELGATLPNQDERLWPGRYVRVHLALTVQRDAVVVPRRAIVTSVAGQSAFVLKKDSTVEQRVVKVERTRGDDMVISAGLQAGELVVTDGQLQLENGSRVEANANANGAQP